MGFYRGPHIVTDGLVLALDAANPLSYPGTGTTWRDLSGNGNNFTLYNGVTFSSENNGCLTFDGLNDYVASTNTIDLSNFNYVVIDVFYKCNTTSISSMVYEHTNNWNSNTGGFGLAANSNGNFTSANVNHTNHNTQGPRNYLVSNNLLWVNNINIHSKILDSTGRIAYVNGNLTSFTTSGTNTVDGGSFTNATFYIGSRGGSSIFFNGSISTLKIYGYKINGSDAIQNYNATKTRFGL